MKKFQEDKSLRWVKSKNCFNCDCIGSQQLRIAIPAASNKNQGEIWGKKSSAKIGQS